MTKKKDEKLGVEFGPDEGEPRKQFGGPPKMMTVPKEPPTNPEPNEPPITKPQAVELFHQQFNDEMAPMRAMVKDLHAIVIGPLDSDGQPVGGEDLVARIADATANKFLMLFQTQVRELVLRVERLEAEREHVGPNGTTPPGGM